MAAGVVAGVRRPTARGGTSLCGEVHLDRLRQSFHPAALAHLAERRRAQRAPPAPAPHAHGSVTLSTVCARDGATSTRRPSAVAIVPPQNRVNWGLASAASANLAALDASTAHANDRSRVERRLLRPRVHHRGVPVPREHRVARGREQLGVLAAHAAGVARPRPGVREEEERGEEGAVGVDDVGCDARVGGPHLGIHAVARAPFVADAGPRALQVATGAPRRLESVEGTSRSWSGVVSGGEAKR